MRGAWSSSDVRYAIHKLHLGDIVQFPGLRYTPVKMSAKKATYHSEYFRKFLAIMPLSQALFRAIEAKHISHTTIVHPVLDLGCGAGEFCTVFFKERIATGIDISKLEVQRAIERNIYLRVDCANAEYLPYKNSSFSTVLSVSVLEHTARPIKIIQEVSRVLKPNGLFILTVNSVKINSLLFWPGVFNRVHLYGLEAIYLRVYHRVFHHVTLWDKVRWNKELTKAGFVVIQNKEIISRDATRMFDVLLPLAWPYYLMRKIIGVRWIWKPEWVIAILNRAFDHISREDETEGSNIFIVAKKAKPKDQSKAFQSR